MKPNFVHRLMESYAIKRGPSSGARLSPNLEWGFLFLRAPGGVGERFLDVVALKIRVGVDDFIPRVAAGDEPHDRSYRHAE